jgi:hypothetical protein
MTPEQTFWNGEPCEARKVTLIVADNEAFRSYWARPLVGTRRNAVEVTYAGSTFYLDDEPFGAEESAVEIEFRPGVTQTFVRAPGSYGWAWDKVTTGRGSPVYGHRDLTPVEGSVEPRDA